MKALLKFMEISSQHTRFVAESPAHRGVFVPALTSCPKPPKVTSIEAIDAFKAA